MKNLTSTEVLQMLENIIQEDNSTIMMYFEQHGQLPDNHGYVVRRTIKKNAPIKSILIVLKESKDSDIIAAICYMLGDLHAKSAIPILIEHLENTSDDVRIAAADALAKIRSPQAGEALFQRFTSEATDAPEQNMLAAALGAVGYRPAIPALINALASNDRGLRGSAAWSLGELHAKEAMKALEQAYAQEVEAYPRERMQIAIDLIIER